MPDTSQLLAGFNFQDAVDLIAGLITNGFILAGIVFAVALRFVPRIANLIKRSVH